MTRLDPDRRAMLLGLAALPIAAKAAAAPAGGLRMANTGLEHLGMTVPNVTATALFYSRLFGPALFAEKEPPLRYYVLMGKAYIAIGHRDDLAQPKLDHFCVLVEGYDQPHTIAALAAAGLPTIARGVIADPDQIGLQFLSAPGGLAPTVVPAPRMLGEGYGLVAPTGMDHVRLAVTDPGRSAAFYDHFFPRAPARTSGEIWFRAADTTIRLSRQAPGHAPAFESFGVRVAPFDEAAVAERAGALGAKVRPGAGRGRLRLDDPNGLGVELIAS